MKKNLLLELFKGFKNGVFIGLCVSIAMSFIYSGTSFEPSPPSFINHFQNELIANSISIICWGIIGMIFVLTSLVFNNTDWSITKMTLTHAITSYVSLLPIALFLNWIDLNGNQMIKFSIIYVLIYIIIWSFFMIKAKREVDSLNSKLT